MGAFDGSITIYSSENDGLFGLCPAWEGKPVPMVWHSFSKELNDAMHIPKHKETPHSGCFFYVFLSTYFYTDTLTISSIETPQICKTCRCTLQWVLWCYTVSSILFLIIYIHIYMKLYVSGYSSTKEAVKSMDCARWLHILHGQNVSTKKMVGSRSTLPEINRTKTPKKCTLED